MAPTGNAAQQDAPTASGSTATSNEFQSCVEYVTSQENETAHIGTKQRTTDSDDVAAADELAVPTKGADTIYPTIHVRIGDFATVNVSPKLEIDMENTDFIYQGYYLSVSLTPSSKAFEDEFPFDELGYVFSHTGSVAVTDSRMVLPDALNMLVDTVEAVRKLQ